MPPRTTRNAAKGKAAGKKPAQQTIVDAMKRTSLRRKEKAPRHESSESEGEGLSELDEMMESEDDEDDTGGAEESKDGETPSKNSKNMDPSAVLTGSYVLSAGNPSELSRRLKKTWKALQETPNQQQDAGVPLEQLRLVCAELFHEKIIDNDEKSVRSLAACCFAELLRVYAPDMPFKANEELYDAFQLILEQLRCLAVEGNEESNSNASSTDLHNLYILESLANVKSCSLLIGMDFTIDENEEPLLIQLFRTFFSTIRKEHSVKIENLMLSVMVSCVEESDTIDQPLLDVILAPLVHGGSAVDNTLMGDKSGQGSIERGPYHMAQELIRRTNDQLQNHLSHFFNSILVEASTAFVHKTSDLKEHVYTLIYEVHKINSSLLLYVLPNVCMQLQVDEIATRSEAIALMGRLFASAHADYGHDYMKNFRDFLGRFRDVSKEIRLQMVQVCAIIWQRKAELAPLIEKEFIQRLSDPEWEVRRLAVNEVCDLAANAIDLVSEDCLRQVGERMKDKKVLIRKETMTGLSQVYAAHISSHWDVQGSNSQGADKAFDLSVTSTANTKKLGWVPDFVLKCFAYPQEELKLRVIQLLDDILLPKAFAEPTRAKGLAFLLHSLDASSKEALRRILSERAKCNAIVGAFLKARRLSRMTSGRPTGNVDESMLRATGVLERGLAPLFSETSNLGKLLEQLVRWKDQSVFKQLEILCDYSASQQDARSARDRLIKSVGSKTALGDFLKNVCRKLNNLTVSQGTIGTYFGFFIANDMHHHRENRVIVDLLLMVSRITPQLFTEFIHEEFEAILVAAEEEPNEESEEEPRERDSKAMLGLLGVLGQFSKHWSANQAEDGLDKPVSSSIPSEKLRESLEQWCLGADSDDDPAGNSSAALALANFFGYSKETEVLVSKLSTKKVLQSPQSPNAQAILQSLGVFSKVCPQHFVRRPTILSSLWQLVFEDFIVQSSQSDESTTKSKRQKRGSSAAKASEIRCAAIRVASNLLIHCHSEADTLLLERGRELVEQLFGILRSDGRKWSSNGAHAAKFRATASRCLLKIVRSRKIEATLSVSEWHMLGFVMQDSSEDVRRVFLKTLTNNLVKKNVPHPHKYLSYLALAATEGNPNLKKSARGLLVAAVERMRRVFEASSSRASAVGSSGADGEDDESRQNSNALMVPEYAIPYVIHLLAHHPDFPAPSSRSFSLYDPLWSDQVQYLSLFFDGLVSGSGARGDNISFLLQMLTKLSECHDVANPDGSSFYPLVECAVLLLKRRIKIQSNLKAFPGQIYLPKQLFVPGRKSSEKSKTARNLSDSDGVRATPAKGIRMSTSLSPIKPSGFGGSFLTMSTPPASSKKRKSSVGTPGDRTSPKSSGPLTPNNGKRDSISGDVADDVTPPRRQSLMRQARSQAKTFVDQSSDSEKEPDDVVLGGSVAARRSKRKSPGAASVVSDKISQVTDEEGEKDNDTSSEPSSKKRTAPSPDDDDSEMPTFRASRRRRQI